MERALEEIVRGKPVLGERMLVVGRGPAGLPGGSGAAVGVGANGALVLVIGARQLGPEAAAVIADRLDRLAALGQSNLQALSEEPLSKDELSRRHRVFYSSEDTPAAFNRDQRVFLVVREAPSAATWKALVIELGKMLGGIWQVRDGEVRPLQPPEEILRRRESPGFSWATALGAAVVVAGLGLGVLALTRGGGQEVVTMPAPAPAVDSPVRDVAFGVAGDATHSQWIAQQRLVRTTDGRLVALYGGTDGLYVVTDQGNQGRSWGSPVAYPGIEPRSFSAAIDGGDNLHIAFSDGSSVSYAYLGSEGRGWDEPVILSIDRDSASPVLDIDHDPEGDRTYLVWAGKTGSGEAPTWAAIQGSTSPRVVHSDELADPGDEIPVLVNVAVGPDSTIHATFRRGDSSFGWFGRRGSIRNDGHVEWLPEERLSSGEGFGAASLAVDAKGVAHLVLRDSTTYQLLYFKRTKRGGWSSPQSAVEGQRVEEIDFPTLSIDSTSKLVYLFFQTDQNVSAGEVSVAVRDPAAGWEGPYRIPSAGQGAGYPTAMAVSSGQPIVLWTTGGEAPSIQAARIIAP